MTTDADGAGSLWRQIKDDVATIDASLGDLEAGSGDLTKPARQALAWMRFLTADGRLASHLATLGALHQAVAAAHDELAREWSSGAGPAPAELWICMRPGSSLYRITSRQNCLEVELHQGYSGATPHVINALGGPLSQAARARGDQHHQALQPGQALRPGPAAARGPRAAAGRRPARTSPRSRRELPPRPGRLLRWPAPPPAPAAVDGSTHPLPPGVLQHRPGRGGDQPHARRPPGTCSRPRLRHVPRAASQDARRPHARRPRPEPHRRVQGTRGGVSPARRRRSGDQQRLAAPRRAGSKVRVRNSDDPPAPRSERMNSRLGGEAPNVGLRRRQENEPFRKRYDLSIQLLLAST